MEEVSQVYLVSCVSQKAATPQPAKSLHFRLVREGAGPGRVDRQAVIHSGRTAGKNAAQCSLALIVRHGDHSGARAHIAYGIFSADSYGICPAIEVVVVPRRNQRDAE
jgi:hypothetical protein